MKRRSHFAFQCAHLNRSSPLRAVTCGSMAEFALFEDDGKDPMWRAIFPDLDEAKRQAQGRADDSGHECFVFCLTNFIEVARSFPSRINSRAQRSYAFR